MPVPLFGKTDAAPVKSFAENALNHERTTLFPGLAFSRKRECSDGLGQDIIGILPMPQWLQQVDRDVPIAINRADKSRRYNLPQRSRSAR